MSASTYIALYYIFLLVFTIWISLSDIKNTESNRGLLSFVLLLGVFIHIGFRPLDPLFGDTRTYARVFNDLCYDSSISINKDVFFYYVSLVISKLTHSTTVYFCILCLGYILPVYFAFKKKLPQSYFLLLFAYVCSFSFWGYGVNGLRNGLGVAFFLLGLFSEKSFTSFLCFVFAVAFHTSLALPVASFLIIKYLNHNPRLFITIWIVCLLVSLLSGHSIGNFLGSIPFINGIDDRMSGYLASSLDELSDVSFSHMGFRWDFVFYSFIPIAIGGFFVFKKRYDSWFYNLMYCIYLLCNSFWLLTIYVPYNNRFAYLSWFLHPILIIYPILEDPEVIINRSHYLHWSVFLNYLFTFIMWLGSTNALTSFH